MTEHESCGRAEKMVSNPYGRMQLHVRQQVLLLTLGWLFALSTTVPLMQR